MQFTNNEDLMVMVYDLLLELFYRLFFALVELEDARAQRLELLHVCLHFLVLLLILLHDIRLGLLLFLQRLLQLRNHLQRRVMEAQNDEQQGRPHLVHFRILGSEFFEFLGRELIGLLALCDLQQLNHNQSERERDG